MDIATRERRWLEAIGRGEHDVSWYEVDGLWWSSAVMIDGFRIAVTYRTALKAAELMGGRLPTKPEALSMFADAEHIEPAIIRPVSSSLSAIKEHSRKVSTLMGTRRLVDNEGKLWLAGAAPGRAINYGWPSTAGGYVIAPGLRGWQPEGHAHNDGHVDYSQTLRVVRSGSPYEDEDRGSDRGASQPPPQWLAPMASLGERAVEFSLHELRKGNLETQGVNAGPRIADYFARCTRGGRPLGIRSGNWCAAGACFAAQQSLLPGETLPHGYRASGIELERDAKAAGTWTEDASEVRRGDLCILPRGAPGSWTRHVCRVMAVDGDMLRTIGANEGTSWRITERRTSDALGFIRYPASTSHDSTIHADAMKRAQKAAHDAAKRRDLPDGMDAVDALIAAMDEEGTG